MITGSKVAIGVVSLAWYREQDYARARASMVDAVVLPPTHREWLDDALRTEEALRLNGCKVVREYLRPKAFTSFCAVSGLSPNAYSRSQFATFEAERRDELRWGSGRKNRARHTSAMAQPQAL